MPFADVKLIILLPYTTINRTQKFKTLPPSLGTEINLFTKGSFSMM